MRNVPLHRMDCGFKAGERFLHQPLMPDIGEKSRFLFTAHRVAGNFFQNRCTQSVNSRAGYGRSAEYLHLSDVRLAIRSKIRFIRDGQRPPLRAHRHQLAIFRRKFLCAVEYHQHQVGFAQGFIGFSDADALRFVRGVANAGGIHQFDGNTAKRDGFRD